MTESTARQLFELLSAFLTGASIAILDLPFRLLRRICPRLGVLWDFLLYAIAGFLVFAAGQWCGAGIRLRFLTAALLGAALCAWVLRSAPRCGAERGAWGRCGGQNEKDAEKCVKKR